MFDLIRNPAEAFRRLIKKCVEECVASRVALQEQSTVPFTGYRVWGLDREDGTLMSCTRRFIWPRRKPMVRDDIQNVGIHAVKNDLRVPTLFTEYVANVAGSVYLWGEVKEHTEGYLAEFAYPKELWMPEDTDPLVIMKVEENYGVPVELRSNLIPILGQQIQQLALMNLWPQQQRIPRHFRHY
jgi:hypothetical protein